MPSPESGITTSESFETSASPEIKPFGLRLILNGQGEGAMMLYEELRDHGHAIVGIVATKKEDDPLRLKAQADDIPIISLGKVNTPENQERMRGFGADLGVGFFLQATLERETYSIPEFGTVNFHISNLPRRRGRDSMNRAIMDGDPTIGMSAYLMNGRIDAGPVVLQDFYENPGNKSQGALYFEHLKDSVKFMSNAVDLMAQGIQKRRESGGKIRLPLIVQDETLATEQAPLTKDDLRIDLDRMTAEQISRFILAGGPGAWIQSESHTGQLNLLNPAVYHGPTQNPGNRSISEDGKSVFYETAQGIVEIKNVQEVNDGIKGQKISAGEYFYPSKTSE